MAKIFPHRVFCVPTERVSLGIGYHRSGSKTRMMWLPDRKNFDDIFSRVDTMHKRDRQTDGQTETPGDSKDRVYA